MKDHFLGIRLFQNQQHLHPLIQTLTMNVHPWISELALAKAITVVDQNCKYLALGNSENQNAFLSEPK